MKLHQLQALVACADTGSIRAAARSLGVSQAAVTRALRELEAAQRVSLLIRTPGGPRFTETGTILLAHARAILNQIDRAQNELSSMRGRSSGNLSIGISPWIAKPFLPDTIELFRTRLPGVRLELFESTEALAQPLLRNGVIDFVFSCLPSIGLTGTDLTIEPFLEYETGILVREGHFRAQSRSLGDLLDQDWVLSLAPDTRGMLIQHVFGQFDLQIDEDRIVAAQTLSMLETMVGAGMCTWAPKILCMLPNSGTRFVTVPIAESYQPSVLGVISRRDTPLTGTASAFLECLHKVIHRRMRESDRHASAIYSSIRLL